MIAGGHHAAFDPHPRNCAYNPHDRAFSCTLDKPHGIVRITSWNNGCRVEQLTQSRYPYQWTDVLDAFDLPVFSDRFACGDSEHPARLYLRQAPENIVRSIAQFPNGQLAMARLCASGNVHGKAGDLDLFGLRAFAHHAEPLRPCRGAVATARPAFLLAHVVEKGTSGACTSTLSCVAIKLPFCCLSTVMCWVQITVWVFQNQEFSERKKRLPAYGENRVTADSARHRAYRRVRLKELAGRQAGRGCGKPGLDARVSAQPLYHETVTESLVEEPFCDCFATAARRCLLFDDIGRGKGRILIGVVAAIVAAPAFFAVQSRCGDQPAGADEVVQFHQPGKRNRRTGGG